MKKTDVKYIDHKLTNLFNPIILDYLMGDKKLAPFYHYNNNDDELEKTIKARTQYPINRTLLFDVFTNQYKKLDLDTNISFTILREVTTFSICSAHQPNLLLGPLYTIYKIVHSLALTRHAKSIMPQYNFIPIFYLGSEDNDLEELDNVYHEGKKYKWETQQIGAVGRMNYENTEELILELIKHLGPEYGKRKELITLIKKYHNAKSNVADTITKLLHFLFNDYGLLILNADNKALKQELKPLIWQDVLENKSYPIVVNTNHELAQHYPTQAFPRPINFFYLHGNIRERIVYEDNLYKILNTNIQFTEEGMRHEIENNPQNFSPNVVLRGLYQEMILPNIAFIGGGGEIAYWLQLKSLFDYYNIHFPMLVLRQSFLWLDKRAQELMYKLDLSLSDIFKDQQALAKELIQNKHPKLRSKLNHTRESIVDTLGLLNDTTAEIDSKLPKSLLTLEKKITHLIDNFESKILRAYKKKDTEMTDQLINLFSRINPQGAMQERQENFLKYYMEYEDKLIPTLLEKVTPYGKRFGIIYTSS